MSAVPEPVHEWRPEILDERLGQHRARLEQLRADTTIDVVDTLPKLRAELATILPKLDSDLLDEPGRWVYYPWRRSIVSILGPGGFPRLRLDRNRNKITASDQQLLAEVAIGVIGQSVGHVIAHTLVMEGLCKRISLADFDFIELSNLNRVPGGLFDIGINKAVVTARRIAELDPYVDVDVVRGGITDEVLEEFLTGLDIVVEECDSLDIKLAVREQARRRRIPVVMETSDRGLIDVERFDVEPDRPVFHGLLADVAAAELQGLSTHDKVPYVLKILEPEHLSAPMAASMAEVDETLTTWPQLAEDVTLGAATVAAVVRRLTIDPAFPSGRARVDLQHRLDELATPPRSETPVTASAPVDSPVVDLDDPVAAVVRAAGLAPSGGNVQPWQFAVDGDEIDVFLLPERSVTMDIGFRGSHVALGAALTNARIGAAAAGLGASIELFPTTDTNHVARIALGADPDPALAAQWPAMLDRCANRQLGSPTEIKPELLDELAELVTAQGATLRLLYDRAEIADCAELLAESDRLRYLNPVLHAEMMSELRWPGRDGLDVGLDVRTLELDAADLAKLEVARRADVMSLLADWNGGRALGERTRDSVVSSSAIAVVTIPAADPTAYLQAGEAVERLWIRAQSRGLGVQPISPIFLYARTREDFSALVGTRHRAELAQLAQRFRSLVAVPDDDELALVVRLSHAPRPTARSQRLSLAALLRPASGRAAEPAADG